MRNITQSVEKKKTVVEGNVYATLSVELSVGFITSTVVSTDVL